METTSPAYRITSKSGTVIADNLPLSAPSIQLHEGVVSKGDKHPKELDPGKSSIVAYPLVEGRMICRVTRIDGYVPIASTERPIEFVEPDPVPAKVKDKLKVSMTLERQADEAIEGAKARRGRGKRGIS